MRPVADPAEARAALREFGPADPPATFAARLDVEDARLSTVIDHVSNVEYVAWLDRVAELHDRSVGLGRESMVERGLCWFVVRHEIDYEAETFRGDRLVLATAVESMRRSTGVRRVVVARPSDDRIVCRARSTWVLVELETRRPRRIPAEVLEAYGLLERTP